MMKRAMLRRLVSLFVVAIPFAVPATDLVAQKSYNVTVPVKDTTLTVRGYYDFPITVTNTTSAPVTYYLSRTKNDLPSTEWYTYLCTRDLCFLPSRDTTDPVLAGPGESVPYKFSVNCGSTPGEVGKFTLVVGDGTDRDTLNFTVQTMNQGAGVDDEVVGPTGAWPSPAGSLITLATPQRLGARVYIFSRSGELMMQNETTGATSLTLNVDNLPQGVYFYRIADGANGAHGSFVIAR